MTPPPSLFERREGRLLLCLALVVLVALAFSPVLDHDFVGYDDPYYVTENPHVTGGLRWRSIATAFTTPLVSNWHPLTLVSHMLDWELFGANPRGHHLTSFLLHLANTLLVLALWRRLGGRALPAALVAALFAVHPLHVEPVAWVSGRKDLLSTLFWLLALLAYAAHARGPTAGRWMAATVLFALALTAKAMPVTFPLLALVLDRWPLCRQAPPRVQVLEKLPWVALAAAVVLVTAIAQGGALAPLERMPVGDRLAGVALAQLGYLSQTVWPAGLAYHYPIPSPLPSTEVALGALLLAATSAAAVALRRRAPWLLCGWLWYLVTLLPVSGIVQIGNHQRADRYVYVPLTGLFAAFAWGLAGFASRSPRRARWASGAAVALVLALALLARQQARHWRSGLDLALHAVQVTAPNDTAWHNLAEALRAAGRPGEAIEAYRRAVALRPRPASLAGLGAALLDAGRAEEARSVLEPAGRTHPADGGVALALAATYRALGQANDSLRVLERAEARNPDDPRLAAALAASARQAGDAPAALAAWRRALARAPHRADWWLQVGELSAELGDLDAAISAYRSALATEPGLAAAHHNLGVALLRQGRTEEATAALRRAAELDPALAPAPQ